MTLSEKQIEEILGQDIQISDTVNKRINDTYKMLETAQKKQRGARLTGRRKRSYIAAAVAACCLIIPTAVYAAANSDFFDAMFGNTTKKSTQAVTKEFDNQKGGTTPVTLPSHEYVSVDPETAKELVGDGAMSEPVEKQLGDHTLRIENMVYDKNSAFIYFTLEREGGVTMLVGNEDTNESKGAYLADDALWIFTFETTEGTGYGEHIYVDTEKSTKDKFYCSAYLLSFEELKEGEYPALKIYKYPSPRAELPDDYEAEEETVSLTKGGAVPMKKIDMGDKGCFEYSPVSMAIDMSKGTGLSETEASDVDNLNHLEIKYKDGTSYVVFDTEDLVDNSSYTLGVGNLYKTTYNRLVDINEIKEFVVNDMTFPVE